MTTYTRQRYLFVTQDPVHIGTGGYRLGRVDNSIVREPGTRVPKIPGTSLHGAARAYAAQLFETPEAAGQSHDGVAQPQRNPVCYTFGYIQKGGAAEDEVTVAYSGTVNIFDALILLFPVYSRVGPVWVSTPQRLEAAGFSVSGVPDSWEAPQALTTWTQEQPLNLGWLMLQAGGVVTVQPDAEAWRTTPEWRQVAAHTVLVKEALFSQIVNSNLEVRTSVSITPETGAAKDGALFTYEAIPRAAFLTADVVLDDYRRNTAVVEAEAGPTTVPVFPPEGLTRTGGAPPHPLPGAPWKGPLDVVRAGFNLLEWLGVGGMGTRGFGRLAVVGEPLSVDFGQLVAQEEGES
jgi:CRISPR-associated protein Cmr4